MILPSADVLRVQTHALTHPLAVVSEGMLPRHHFIDADIREMVGPWRIRVALSLNK